MSALGKLWNELNSSRHVYTLPWKLPPKVIIETVFIQIVAFDIFTVCCLFCYVCVPKTNKKALQWMNAAIYNNTNRLFNGICLLIFSDLFMNIHKQNCENKIVDCWRNRIEYEKSILMFEKQTIGGSMETIYIFYTLKLCVMIEIYWDVIENLLRIWSVMQINIAHLTLMLSIKYLSINFWIYQIIKLNQN
jgi:hypothetical protein